MDDPWPWQKKESEVRWLIETYGPRLTPDQLDHDSLRSLNDAGEWGVAFEHITTQMYEYDVLPDESDRPRIAAIGTSMGIDPSYWDWK